MQQSCGVGVSVDRYHPSCEALGDGDEHVELAILHEVGIYGVLIGSQLVDFAGVVVLGA